MKALFFPFEFIYPQVRGDLDGDSIIEISRDFTEHGIDLPLSVLLEHSIHVRDIFNLCMLHEYFVVVYHKGDIPEKWVDVYGTTIGKYYGILEESDFLHINRWLDLDYYLTAMRIDPNDSFLVCSFYQFDEGEINGLGFRRVWQVSWRYEDLYKVVDLGLEIETHYNPERMEVEALNAILAVIEIIAEDSFALKAYLFQLELILSEATSRNDLLWAIISYLKELIEPELSRLEYNVYKREIAFPLFNIYFTLDPQQLTLYLLMLNHPTGVRYSEVPNHAKEMINTYRRITGADWDTCRKRIANLIKYRSSVKSQINNEEIIPRLGRARALYYIIEMDKSDRWNIWLSRHYPDFIAEKL